MPACIIAYNRLVAVSGIFTGTQLIDPIIGDSGTVSVSNTACITGRSHSRSWKPDFVGVILLKTPAHNLHGKKKAARGGRQKMRPIEGTGRTAGR